jgi:hypothetical protein
MAKTHAVDAETVVQGEMMQLFTSVGVVIASWNLVSIPLCVCAVQAVAVLVSRS